MAVPVKLRPAPLWKPRFSSEFFEEMERSPRAEVQISYNRGYRLNAVSDSDKVFPSFESCRQRGIVLGDIIRNDWPKFVGVDLSGSKRKGNAIVSGALDPVSKRRYVIDVRTGLWRSSETAEQIGIVFNLVRPSVIMVEDNGYQDSLIDWIKAAGMSFGHLVEPTTTTGYSKSSTTYGLPALEIEFKNQMWVVPYSEYEGALPEDPGARGWWAMFDQQFRNYPFAPATDFVMSTWFMRQGMERFLHFYAESGGGSVGNLNVR